MLIKRFAVLVVAFRPDGKELAVAALNGQITFWDHENAVQTGSIEGRHDLQMGRKELDKITAKQSAKGKYVNEIVVKRGCHTGFCFWIVSFCLVCM